MSEEETKYSRKWYKRRIKEWDRYVGDHATVQEYAAGMAPYFERLRNDLTEWWGDHPRKDRRLTPEEIEALARRLADLVHAWTSPITPPETADLLRPYWVPYLQDESMRIPDNLPKLKPIFGNSAAQPEEDDKDKKPGS